MPIVPENISDLYFNERDLYLDVRLTTLSNEGKITIDPDTGLANEVGVEDFTGYKTFKSGFFKESTGFGITNIKVETNTSLQPIVDIEFKDLYGKTVFGELSDSEIEGVNYAALFQWPPPKFIFTFKGYLGSPVTWLLNMKTTSTQYNSDDGSYTIKATFVPNQWGMFGDLPFLYLYAAKKLRADKIDETLRKDSKEFIEATEGVIDLMYIGKTVEVETKNVNKEYDEVVQKLELLKRDPIQGLIGGTFNIDDEIVSSIGGRGEIEGFKKITIKSPGPEYTDEKKENLFNSLKNLNGKLRNVENYKIKIKAAGLTPSVEVKFGQSPSNADFEKLKEESKRLNDIIDKNLELIDSAIKANVYLEKKDELKKLTISEVFKTISRDAAYIMGYIIDAGEQGYLNNIEARNEAEKNDTIGRYYPMKFEEPKEGSKDLGKQVPVKDLGVEDFERKFITDFVTAISYGIAENKALQAEANLDGDKKIKNIINNLEIGTDNPYIDVTDWSVMASIIIKRAAILGFITQSYNPALPGNLEPDGDATNVTGDYKKLDLDKIRSLADSDLNNLSSSILGQLNAEGLQKLKEFCFMVTSTLVPDPDAEDVFDTSWFYLKGLVFVLQPGLESLTENTTTKNIIKKIRKQIDEEEKYYFVRPEDTFGSMYDKNRNILNIDSSLRETGFIGYTVEQFMGNLIGPDKAFFGQTTAQKYDGQPKQNPTYGNGLDFETSMGTWVGMNGVIFTHVCHGTNENYKYSDNGMEYAVFSSSDDISRVGESLTTPGFQPPPQEDDEETDKQKDTEEVDDEIAQIVNLSSNLVPKDKNKSLDKDNRKINEFLSFYNKRIKGNMGNGVKYSFLNYSSVVKNNMKKSIKNNTYNPSNFSWNTTFGPTPEGIEISDSDGKAEENFVDVNLNPVIIAPYAQYPSLNENRANKVPLAGALYPVSADLPENSTSHNRKVYSNDDEVYYAQATLVFLRQLCKGLKPKIQKIQDEIDKVFGSVLGKAGEHDDLIYQQMHTLFHQWQILGSKTDGSKINLPKNPNTLTPNVALELQKSYSENLNGTDTPNYKERDDGNVVGGGFRYDYPLQSIDTAKENRPVRVEDSIINIKPLYSAKANTTVLNVFQQLCSKNNFMFFPICGNARYNKVTDIFTPQEMMGPKVGNFFQVMFQPTPESRTLVGNNPDKKQSTLKNLKDFDVEAFPVAFGDPTNKIIKNVQVSTDDNKVTAESIVNLQSIVDNENKNRTVTTDCSLLSVFEGRSYKAGIETLGNAQISPMQFFFLENHTIFTGLYQIIKVSHKISPNNMTTDLQGIKMRYGGQSYGGVRPITLQDYEQAAVSLKFAPLEDTTLLTQEEKDKIAAENAAFENASSSRDGVNSSSESNSTDSNNYQVTGTDIGSKDVAVYLSNKTTKNRINKIIKECIKQGINSDYAIASVLAICSKESSFNLVEESFVYSASRLPEVFSYFKKNDPIKNGFVNPKTQKADSKVYQEKIANIIYTQKPIGIRKDGYGNTSKGDGWKYRGRGYNQITFKSGYQAASKYTGVDLVANPERLLEEDVATSALVGFFNNRRTTKNFGPSGKRVSREVAYSCTDNGITFSSLKDAVFFYYHLNAGPGYEVSHIKAKLSPSDKLGGMNKSQQRAPEFLNYIKNNFKNDGIKFLG